METFGARCVAEPHDDRMPAGRSSRATRTPGSLGIAISEAVEVGRQREDTKYSLGSRAQPRLLHQTVIGQEALEQIEMAGDYPDVMIGCAGGGSNFAGLAFPFLGRSSRRARTYAFVAVEPAACPSLTQGEYALRLRRYRRH